MDTAPHNPSDVSIPVIAPAPVDDPGSRGSAGSVVAILLIVFLLVVGAFYVWGQRLTEQHSGQYAPAIGQ